MINTEWFMLLSICLFALGLGVVISKQNLIMMLMGIELMLNAANINLVAFSNRFEDPTTGQLSSLFIMIIAAAEVTVALAIILKIKEMYGTVNPDQIDELKY